MNRDELIKFLVDKFEAQYADGIADFIIKDRQRLYDIFIHQLKDLPIIPQPMRKGFDEKDLWVIIKKYETLKLAGVKE